ncbi:MAG: hypothetical protein HY390_07790 [Deltaproteobacteria bacterium]|nr:hypothetical protein [Deltaproteobacteria bacterium]
MERWIKNTLFLIILFMGFYFQNTLQAQQDEEEQQIKSVEDTAKILEKIYEVDEEALERSISSEEEVDEYGNVRLKEPKPQAPHDMNQPLSE